MGLAFLCLQLESSVQLKSQHIAIDYKTKYFHNFLGFGTLVSSCRRWLYFETQFEPIFSTQDLLFLLEQSYMKPVMPSFLLFFVNFCLFLNMFVITLCVYLCIKFMFVCCLKLCSWNEKKEELSKPFIKIFTSLLLPYLIDREHHQGLTNMCLCVSLYCGQMLSVCFILVSKCRSLQWNKH